MKQFNIKIFAQRGSMMVEALAMLGLITMVTPILYKKAAERTTELQDINTATQMRMISSAFDQYMKDNYNQLKTDRINATGGSAGEGWGSDISSNDIKKYLPKGFDITNSKLFNDMKFKYSWKVTPQPVSAEDEAAGVKKDPLVSFTTAVLAPYREEIARARSSKIASMIGANGGNYLKNDTTAKGVQGLWQLSLSGSPFSLSNNEKKGGLVVISSDAINTPKGEINSDDVLYRTNAMGTAGRTMKQSLIMGGNPIEQVTKLIANSDKGNTVQIGENENNGNLLVKGITTLEKALTVKSGGIKINAGGLTVDNGGATITSGGLTVTSGGATITNGGLTVTNGGATISNGNLNVNNGKLTVKSGGAEITGTTKVIGAFEATGTGKFGDKLTVSNNGAAITGDLTVSSGSATIAKKLTVQSEGAAITGNLTVSSGADITGNTKVTGTFEATNDATFGGSATISGDTIVQTDLVAGGSAKGQGKLEVYKTAREKNLGSGSNLAGLGKTDVWANDNTLTNVDNLNVRGKLQVHGDAYFNKGIYLNGRLLDIDNGDHITINGEPTIDTEWIIAQQGFALNNKNSPNFLVTNAQFYYQAAGGNNRLLVDANGVKLKRNSINYVFADGAGIAIGKDLGSEQNFIGKTTTDPSAGIAPQITANNNMSQADVIITAGNNTPGIIEVKAPTGTTDRGHFVRARRFVSDKEYSDSGNFVGRDTSGSSLGAGNTLNYNYYQIDPAYTSVMNDIKLSSRGGARLSDILPDYINKGIYVVDNTYKDENIPNGYPIIRFTSPEGYTIGGKAPAAFDSSNACDSRSIDCQASPWLGFVPTPLCPPTYDRAITLSPFRWKMAETFYVQDDVNNPLFGGTKANNKTQIQGNFFVYFNRYEDPKDAIIQGERVPGEDKEYGPFPTTLGITNYQTNTWLNTSISPAWDSTNGNSGDANFMGWHALMGFMYHGMDYSALLGHLFDNVSPNDIYWNVFPVYAGELAAFANTYCVFNRQPCTNDNCSSREWMWGNNSPVLHIDQLNNFRKNAKPLNANGSLPYIDPQLPYGDAW